MPVSAEFNQMESAILDQESLFIGGVAAVECGRFAKKTKKHRFGIRSKCQMAYAFGVNCGRKQCQYL
ncbi:hypothetical protein PILCRDRAFT_813794 [Piloderma croceum F 1598]|uniref:Uncharacterized protein n=1 Tax=Piloderma croceum (strain F 1598) TaxID=765440 RepID=A0A0C3FX46_PILCF|nr:hypothetical protein PILCRDRAFT_813794 [Piloderma croceum F 1598]